jgi:hypothetical protein
LVLHLAAAQPVVERKHAAVKVVVRRSRAFGCAGCSQQGKELVELRSADQDQRAVEQGLFGSAARGAEDEVGARLAGGRGCTVEPAQADQLMHALPARQQVQAQERASRAVDALDEVPVRAQFLC